MPENKDSGGERMILNPNCSEAVCRISLENLSEEEKEKLLDIFRAVDSVYYEADFTSKEVDESKPVNESHISAEMIAEIKENWYDTNWVVENIFGMEVIVIRGEVPYNESDWLSNFICKNVDFWEKLKIEFSDS